MNLSYKINDGYLKQSHDHELHLSGVDCPKWWHGNMNPQPSKLFKFIGTSWDRPIWVWITVWIKITFLKYPPPETKNCPEPSWASKVDRWHCIRVPKNSSIEEKLCIAGSWIDVRIWLSVLDYSDEHCEYHYPDAWLVFMVEEGCLRSWCLVTFLLDEGVFLFQCLRQGCCVLSALAVTCTFIEGFFRVVLLYNVSRSQSAILPQMNKKPVTSEWSTSSLFLDPSCVFLVFQLKWCLLESKDLTYVSCDLAWWIKHTMFI